jgi:hypothetical protein
MSSAAESAVWPLLSTVDPTIWASIIGGALTSVATVAAVVVAAVLAYRHARDHSKRQHSTSINVDRLRREIDALERVWSLLAFVTFAENDVAVVRYREDRQKNRTYYVNLANLRRFILTEVRTTFYTGHAGLHLPNAIRDELFEYQGSLMGLYLRYETANEADTPLIELENANLIKKLRDHDHTLNAALKAELEKRYREMLEEK